MADKMDKKLAVPLLPPVAVEKRNKKAPLFPAVQLVCLWVLLTAAIMGVSFALSYSLVQRDIHPPSWWSLRDGFKPDEAAAEATTRVMKWCSVAQAAAAALALLLPVSRGCRRALAYAALAAAAASHLMLVSILALFLTADPGRISYWIAGAVDMYVLARGDLYCLMALLGRGDYANVPC